MAGALHGLRQTNIRKHTTQTRGAYFGLLDEHCIRRDIFGERLLKGSKNIQSIGMELGTLNVLQMLGLYIVATLQSIVKHHNLIRGITHVLMLI